MTVLHVPLGAGAAPAAALVILLGADLAVSARRREPERVREAALWTAAAVAAAVAFGAPIASTAAGGRAGQLFGGRATGDSLSPDHPVLCRLPTGARRGRRAGPGPPPCLRCCVA